MSDAEASQRTQSFRSHGRGRGQGRGRGSRSEAHASQADPEVQASSTTMALFGSLRTELDEHHNKMERLIRVSRDVTAESKKVIFTLQRYNLVRDKALEQGAVHPANARILQDAHQAIEAIRLKIVEAVRDEHLDPSTAVGADRYERNYGSGLEEFIEALSMMYFLENRSLIPYSAVQELFHLPRLALTPRPLTDDSAEEPTPSLKRRATGELISSDTSSSHRSTEFTTEAAIESTPMDTGEELIQAFDIPPERYILGISDVAGELMRVATNAVGGGDVTGEVVTAVLNTLRELYRTLEEFYGRLSERSGRELKKKQSVTQESIRKIENVLYTVRVRASEYADADVALLQEMVRRSLAESSAPAEEEE